MSQSNSSTEHFGWSVFAGATPEIQEQYLRELDLDKNLPLVTWQGQVGMLDGAPAEIIIKYLPQVYWKAQVVLVDKHMPAGRIEETKEYLHPLAVKKLGLAPRSKKPVRRWSYK